LSVLRPWFGPSREEIWRQLCREIGAEFVDGGTWKGDRVRARHGEWTITLDTFAVHTGKATMVFTRLRAPYVNPDHFRFSITRRGWFSGIAEKLGAQDVEVGFRDFDEAFVIKGTSASKLKQLFADEELRRLLEAQPELNLSVKDHEGWFGPDFPADTDELYLQVGGDLREIARLKSMFEVLGKTLDALCRIGSAYERTPRVEL
jgi:hypothetical protein